MGAGGLSVPDGRLSASYASFYFANRAVRVPFLGVDADREALAILKTAIPDRPIVPIFRQDLVLGLGDLHCLTQHKPAPPSDGS
jgi:agmatine deiminase